MDSQAAQAADREQSALAVAEALIRKLEHVLEPQIRRHLVRESLLAETADSAVALMGAVLRHPPASNLDWRSLRDLIRDLLLSLPDGSPPGLPYPVRRELYRAANRQQDEDVMRVLRSPPGEEDDKLRRRLPPNLADVPLGRRRALAKGDETRWLDLLALDPDPVVTRNLLRNPRLREAEVIRIAALRPVAPETLHEIAASARWSVSPRIRVAIARNPHCPVDLAAKMLVSLPLTELRKLRHDPDLPAATQEEVAREWSRRVGESA